MSADPGEPGSGGPDPDAPMSAWSSIPSEPTVPVAPPPPPPPRRRVTAPGPPVSRLWWASGPISAAVLITIVVLLIRSVPYVVFVPGSATPVEPLIGVEAVDGGALPELDDVGEHILFTTVSVEYPTGALVLRRTIDDHADIAPAEQYFGTQSPEENRRYNQALMTDSKDKATKVALEVLGFEIETEEIGAVLLDVDPSYPSSEVLHPGDTIVAADGTPVRRSDDLVSIIDRFRPGDELEITVQPLDGGDERTVTVRLGADPDDADQPRLGVSLATRPHFTFPFEVTIDSGEVGGPSAGLAFTLALIDLLSPGELTGGRIVAVTGTIELDGAVGPVGGVRQKTEAAVRNGAAFFLVPPHEFDEAVAAADGRLEVVAVSNIDEALEALVDLGGDPVERVDAAD